MAMKQKNLPELVPQVFEHEQFGSIRVVIIDDEPYFVGIDIAKALGYKRERDALKEHVPDKFKLTRQITASGQRRNVTLINEHGMYRLVLRSKLPAAEQFTDWTCEVLVSIRKTGSYSVDGEESAKLAETDKLIKLAELTKNQILREGLIRQAATLLTGKDIAEIEKNPSQNFIENFIDKFCVRNEKGSITRHDFLEKLRIECSEEAAKLTDNALTNATSKINGIRYGYDKLSNRSFCGIKWKV